MKMDIKNMVRDFASLGEAKKRSSVYVKAVSLLCAAIVALVLFFMNMTVRGVTDRILVVNTGGEFLQLKSMETDKLYETLLKAHCNAVAYYVNSFHVDVKEPITITEKIKREAPFHAITRGGHITYVELDGEAQKNVKAIAKIVKVMHDEGIGYGSINHPVDTCQACGYKGVIYDKCPVCQSENIMRMRRITGYWTGDLSTWNSAKRAEERDRVKHG